MLQSSFEQFVAWRHLRDVDRRPRKVLVLGLVLIVLAVAAFALDRWGWRPQMVSGFIGGSRSILDHAPPAGRMARLMAHARPVLEAAVEYAKTAGVIAAVLGVVITFLGLLLRSFTLFTAFSIFGVFLGTAAPILALSVMSGFESDLKSKIRATKADVVITSAEERPFTGWEDLLRRVKQVPQVKAAMPYLETEVIVKQVSSSAGMGIVLRGIDPASAAGVLPLARTLKEGKLELLEHPEEIPLAPPGYESGVEMIMPGREGTREKIRPADTSGHGTERVGPPVLPGILLGEELYSRTLRVFLGSDVDVACPLCGVGPAGPMPKLKTFRVAGHFYSGMYEFDSKLAYVALADAQKFLAQPGEITGIEVRTVSAEAAPEVARRIEAQLGKGYDVRSWEELNRSLFAALKLEKVGMFVGLTFIVLVASFSIVSTLIMMMTEKAREIAILKSMGASDLAVMRIFIAEGLYIGLLGMVMGVVAGVVGCLLIARYGLPINPDVYYIQKLPVVMRAGEIAAVAAAALGLSVLATLYPAAVAARLKPVEGLRYE